MARRRPQISNRFYYDADGRIDDLADIISDDPFYQEDAKKIANKLIRQTEKLSKEEVVELLIDEAKERLFLRTLIDYISHEMTELAAQHDEVVYLENEIENQEDKINELNKEINVVKKENKKLLKILNDIHYKTSPVKGTKRKIFVADKLLEYEEGVK